jgi:hypothetical protein
MKIQIKSALVAIAVAAAAVSAQAATYNGDLLLGFTVGSGSDLEFDIGPITALASGDNWNLSSLLGGLNVSSVKWGVIGTVNSGGIRSSYQTKVSGLPGTLASAASWTPINSAVGSIGSLFTTLAENQNIAPSSTLANSWNQQTVVGGTSRYATVNSNPNATGYTMVNFYKTTADGSAPSLLGHFDFNQNGIVTFSAVPEPATFGAIAGAGLLIVALRTQFRRKLA